MTAEWGRAVAAQGGRSTSMVVPASGVSMKMAEYAPTRGLHSFTFRLNVSAFYGIGGALGVA